LQDERRKHRAMVEIPSILASNIIEVHGDRGREWLDQLPSLIDSIEAIWSIQVRQPFDSLTYHYVVPVTTRDGTEAILKLGIPDSHFNQEVECLRRYGGEGAVQIFEVNTTLGAMLLERIRPGSNLTEVDECEAMDATVNVMERLHRAKITDIKLPTVHVWSHGFQRLRDMFEGGTGPLPEQVVMEAEKLFVELALSTDSPVLLHGDLHHGNILASEHSGWVAIDPQGVIGEACYELGAFFRNPMPELLSWPDLEEVMTKRAVYFSERTGFHPERILAWAFSQAVLSAIWSIEDHGSGWKDPLQIAMVIRAISS
jgi:streptomycin 6-kinase